MFEFATKLLLGRQFQIEKGSIKLLERSILLVPAEVLVQVYKANKDQGRLVYNASVKAAKEMSTHYEKRLGIKGTKLEDLLINLTELAGWGVMRVVTERDEDARAVFNIENSNVAITYGKSKEPVDHLARGFLAGGASVIFKEDVECVETKCLAMGSPYCQFIVDRAEALKKDFPSLYKKQVRA